MGRHVASLVVDQTLSQNKKNQINQSSQESSETYLKEF
jgi:hypothetical protein